MENRKYPEYKCVMCPKAFPYLIGDDLFKKHLSTMHSFKKPSVFSMLVNRSDGASLDPYYIQPPTQPMMIMNHTSSEPVREKTHRRTCGTNNETEGPAKMTIRLYVSHQPVSEEMRAILYGFLPKKMYDDLYDSHNYICTLCDVLSEKHVSQAAVTDHLKSWHRIFDPADQAMFICQQVPSPNEHNNMPANNPSDEICANSPPSKRQKSCDSIQPPLLREFP
ncbi:uncharacterized protein LOC129571630 [Sitodiplosis mosellana]|uniref:uncharacterized protein LOC129571630 n=1 Tax=Sitodiplosis mosellana TaxID=263140 RepID=UPI002444AE52|nr:uncharacterized protein LOC129571630 [Sitodiplosis mosellana]